MDKVWDKIFLIVCLVLLGGGSIYLGLADNDKISSLRETATRTKKGAMVAPLNVELLQQNRDNWLKANPWVRTDADHQLFVDSKFLFFPGRNSVEPYDENTMFDGLPAKWMDKYGLSITDPLVGHRDPDGDGFSNYAEYTAGTDPLDPSSHPPYTLLMRMSDYTEKPYRIRFENKIDIDGESQFQLRTTDSPSKRTHYVKLNEVFDGFKVIDFKAKSQVPQPPRYISDISELQLLNLKTGETITTVIDEETNAPEISVTIIILTSDWKKTSTTVKVGSTFKLLINNAEDKTVNEYKYKLTHATADSAEILDESTNTKVTIKTFDEKADLLQVPR